jgi:hypothetical protein
MPFSLLRCFHLLSSVNTKKLCCLCLAFAVVGLDMQRIGFECCSSQVSLSLSGFVQLMAITS